MILINTVLEHLLIAFSVALAQEANPAVVFDPIIETDSSGETRVIRFTELPAGRSREAAVTAYTQLDYGMARPSQSVHPLLRGARGATAIDR